VEYPKVDPIFKDKPQRGAQARGKEAMPKSAVVGMEAKLLQSCGRDRMTSAKAEVWMLRNK